VTEFALIDHEQLWIDVSECSECRIPRT